MTTPASRIDTLINKEKERVEVLTVRALSYLGELCVIEARNRPQEISWYDRSGNLRSSIGYAIIHNGKYLNTQISHKYDKVMRESGKAKHLLRNCLKIREWLRTCCSSRNELC